MLNEVSHQSEASLISFFVGGLKLELRSELKVGRPTTLCREFSMQKLYESPVFTEAVGVLSLQQFGIL